MIDLIRFFIGVQLMINGFVASVHLLFIAMGVAEQFKTKVYFVSAAVAFGVFLFVACLPLIDRFVEWVKA